MTKDEKFAIYWCFNRAMDYVEKNSPNDNPYEHHTGKLDIIVNCVNINETIRNLLGRLVV
jgi:hypothetical protein